MKIFFDVDGVLIDGWHVNAELRKPWNVNLENDLGVNVKDFEAAFFRASSGEQNSVMERCVVGRQDLKEALSSVLPELGCRGTVEEFLTYWLEKDSNINPDVFEIVTRLNVVPGVELYVATGQEHYRASYLWNQLGFSRHFTKMYYSADIGHLKSSPGFFEAINEELGFQELSEAFLFFDDSEPVVKAARSAGWEGVVFNSIDDLREHPEILALL